MNCQRYLLLSLLLCTIMCCFFLPLSAAAIHPQDSLRTLLSQTKDPQKRIKLLINLDDYCRYVSGEGYPASSYALLNEAIKAKNEYAIARALRSLVMAVDKRVRSFTNDSVARYLQIADQHLSGENRKSLMTEIHLKQIRQAVDWTDNEEKTIADITARYTTSDSSKEEDIYHQIEREYAMGKITGLMISSWRLNSFEAQVYFDNLLALLRKLPVQYRANIIFDIADNFFAAYFNAEEKAKAVEIMTFMMSTMDEYKELDFVQGEAYLNFDYECSLFYETMARCPEIIGKEKAYNYLQKFESMPREDGEMMMTYYHTCKEFYKGLGDNRNVILYGDSVLLTLKKLGLVESRAVVSAVYKEQAHCFANLYDYKRAYECFLQYDMLQDSIVEGESTELREEMGVRYNINQLELETTKLESRNRTIALLSTCVFLFLSVAWGIHQRINYKKIQRVQKKLIESNEEVTRQSRKAQESEKMKTAFINSMCHEIRTPLNSINGFSSLLLDESIDNEMKAEFPELIQQNTNQLTRLINDLLEVSGLDSSDEELPVEDVDLHALCEQELAKLKDFAATSNVDYRLEIREEDSAIRSHHTYLGRVIGNLLNNAAKFTAAGSITINCCKDRERQELVITITDTGIGIPVDKQEWVFGRFTKVDDYKAGTGLGLYVCRLIMNRLNGTIRIAPEYVEGTRFILTLPL